MRKSLYFLVLVLFLIFGLLQYNKILTKSNSSQQSSSQNNLSFNQAEVPDEVSQEKVKEIPSSDGEKPGSVKLEPKTESFEMQQARQWLEDQASSLDQPNMNESEANAIKRLSEHVAKASELEKKLWQETILNSKLAQNKRVFSLYLITLDQKIPAQEIAKLILNLPSTDQSFAAHSTDEQKQTQEKALKAMAIDALFERARNNDAAAHDEIQRLARDSAEEWLRNYAMRKLRGLGKSN